MNVLTVTFLIFMTLKLAGALDWSWWWVSFPLVANVVLFGVSLAVAAIWPSRASLRRQAMAKRDWREGL